jgi:hypothetical protein
MTNTASNSKALPVKDVNLARISLSQPKKHEFGLLAYINYGDGALRFALPSMKIPWAAGESKYDTKTVKSIDLCLNFEGMDSNQELREAYEKCCELDSRIADLVVENKARLYPKDAARNLPNDDFRRRYQNMVSHATDPNGASYAPRIKIRLERDTEDPNKITNKSKKAIYKDLGGKVVPLTVDNVSHELAKGEHVKTYIQAKYLFVSPARTTVTWVLKQAKKTSSIADDDWDLDDDVAPAEQTEQTERPHLAPVDPEGFLDEDEEDEELRRAGL